MGYDEEEEEEEYDEEEKTSLLESPIYSNIPGWQLWQVYPCPWLATVSLTSGLWSGLLPSPTKSSPSPTPTNVARLCIFNAGGFRAVTNLISTLLVCSNDSDGTVNSKEHYFCYNTNVKL